MQQASYCSHAWLQHTASFPKPASYWSFIAYHCPSVLLVLLAVNNNQPTYPENFKQAIESFDKNEDGMMDFDEFKELNDKFPMILFPAFRLQDKMQSKMLGESQTCSSPGQLTTSRKWPGPLTHTRQSF